MPILAAIVFLAFVVEATLGFGATVITVALGTLVLPLDHLLPAFVPVNVVLSAYLVIRHRRDVEWRFLLTRIVPLMLLGLPLGLWAFGAVDPHKMKMAYGAFVVVLSALELVRMARTRAATLSTGTAGDIPAAQLPPLPRVVETTLLALAGVVHGAFSTGGPMAVYVAGRTLADKARFRATMSALWLTLNPVLLATYAATGKLGRDSLATSAGLIVSLLVGAFVGELLHARVPARTFRGAVFSLLLVVGTVTIARA